MHTFKNAAKNFKHLPQPGSFHEIREDLMRFETIDKTAALKQRAETIQMPIACGIGSVEISVLS